MLGYLIRGFRSRGLPRAATAPAALHARLGCLSLIEVGHAEALAGELFRGAFHAAIPETGRHFVLLHRVARHTVETVGYVHHAKHGAAYLAGGLVVSSLAFRRLDRETADAVRAAGGLAEWIMRVTTAWLQSEAVFAYMGDARSIRVNERVGFRFTGREHLYVLWSHDVPEARRKAMIEQVAALGAF